MSSARAIVAARWNGAEDLRLFEDWEPPGMGGLEEDALMPEEHAIDLLHSCSLG